MRGVPFLIRLQNGLRKPKNPSIGSDIAGRVEAVGKGVTKFQRGDEVFGGIGFGRLCRVCSGSGKQTGLKPANISFEAASAVPVAAVTALQALRDKGQIERGKRS